MKGIKSLRSLTKNVFGKSSSTSRVVMSSERAFSDKSTSPTHEDDASKETEEEEKEEENDNEEEEEENDNEEEEEKEEENDNEEPTSEEGEANNDVGGNYYYPIDWNIQQGPFKRSPVFLPTYPNTGAADGKEKGETSNDEEKEDSDGESSSGEGCSHCGCSGCKGCVGGNLKCTGCGCGKEK